MQQVLGKTLLLLIDVNTEVGPDSTVPFLKITQKTYIFLYIYTFTKVNLCNFSKISTLTGKKFKQPFYSLK